MIPIAILAVIALTSLPMCWRRHNPEVGSLTARFGALRILFLAGLLHGATNLCYVWQAHAGADNTVQSLFCDTHLLLLQNLRAAVCSGPYVLLANAARSQPTPASQQILAG